MRRLTCVLAALLVALAATTDSALARTDDLDKDVVLVSGPELGIGGNPCASWKPFQDLLKQSSVTIKGQTKRFTGQVFHVAASPWPNSKATCLTGKSGNIWPGTGANQLKPTMREVALPLAQRLDAISGGKPIDVVAHGSAGVVVRWALMMSERNRKGITSFDGDKYPKNLDVEDVVTLGSPHAPNGPYAATCSGSSKHWLDFCLTFGGEEMGAEGKFVYDLLGSDTDGGLNPQGVKGTDWSAFGPGGDVSLSPEQATTMDAAHKTIYKNNQFEDKLTVVSMLSDADTKKDAQLRFQHGASDWAFTNKGKHTLARAVDDLARGGEPPDEEAGGTTGAYAKGCTGYNDLRTNPGDARFGETVWREHGMVGWKGEPGDVRVVRTATMDASSTCFKARGKDEYVTKTVTRVNGLDVIPYNGATIVLDVKARKLKTEGQVNIALPCQDPKENCNLWMFNDLDWRYPATDGPVTDDDGLRLNAKLGEDFKLFGLRISGGIQLHMVKGGTQLTMSAGLPGIFSPKVAGGASGAGQCANGQDDDDDQKIDTSDPDCSSPSDDFENEADQLGATVTVGVTNKDGVKIEKAGGTIEGAFRFGSFTVTGGATLEYDRQEQLWKVTARAKWPMLGINEVGVLIEVAMKAGQLSSLYGQAESLDFPIGTTGVHLQRLGMGIDGLQNLGIAGKPFDVRIGLGVSYLRKIAALGDKAPIEIDGDATLRMGAPIKWRLEGGASVMGIPLVNGFAGYEYGGNGFEFAADFGPRIVKPGMPHIEPKAKISGVIGGFDAIDMRASVTGCIVEGEIFGYKVERYCALKADYRLSKYSGFPLTQSFCYQVIALGRDDAAAETRTYKIGFVHKVFDNGKTDFDTRLISACDVDEDHAIGGRSAQAGGEQAFTIEKAGAMQLVKLTGRGGSPVVTLVGPKGERISTPTDRMSTTTADAHVMTGWEDQTWVVLHRPSAGRWRIEPHPQSPPIAGVRMAGFLPKPSVDGKLSRSRTGALVLRHRVVRQPGQEVRFVERGNGILRELGRSRGGRGTLRFTATPSRDAKREIVAVIAQAGTVREEKVVARFRAPAAAKPARPSRVKMKLRGDDVVVTWRRAAGATGGYAVEARLPDGRSEGRLVRAGRKRSVVFHGLRAAGRMRVKIVGVRAHDQAVGKSRVATLRVR